MNAKNHDIEGKYANNSLLCVMFSVKGKVVSSMEFCLWLLEETSASAAPTERPTWLFQAGRKNDFTRFYKILYQRRWGGRLTGWAELCKLATFQKNTLLSVAVSNSSVPKWLLRKPRFHVSASCAVETVASAIASEGKIARKHNSAPVACLCQCRGASRCQTGTPAACTCLTTVSRKGTPPRTKIDFFRALLICQQN